MKKTLLNILRIIVGCESGFAGEGNEHWFYALSLVINSMLIWWLNTPIAWIFTLLAVIHYATIFLYGYFGLYEYYGKIGAILRYGYIIIHLAILVIAIIISLKWALITAVITVISQLLAPDCTGNNIVLQKKSYSKLTLVFNAIIMATFVVIDFLLPIKLWIKIIIVIVALILHPCIDCLEGECIEPTQVTIDVFEEIKNHKEN